MFGQHQAGTGRSDVLTPTSSGRSDVLHEDLLEKRLLPADE